MKADEAKVIAMGLFIEQCVRDNRLDLIPPGEFIPPPWMCCTPDAPEDDQ